MTLHWWMHWFWVTAQLAVILASPLPSTTQGPRSQGFPQNLTQKLKIQVPSTTLDPTIVIEQVGQIIEKQEEQEQPESSTRGSFRVAKAIGSYDQPSRANTASANHPLRVKEAEQVSGDPLIRESTERVFGTTAKPQNDRNWNGNPVRARTSPGNMITRQEGHNATGGVVIPTAKRDSRITWVLTTSRPPVRRRTDDSIAEDIIRNFSSVSQEEEEKDLTVLPLRVEGTRFKLVVNRTRTFTASGAEGFSTRTFNGSEDIEIDQELAEPRLAATAASILQGGISDSTRLSRARNTLSNDFQRDREEDRSSEFDESDVIQVQDESVNTEIDSSTPSAVDIAAITGSCLATVVLISTMASIGFVMYRRKYLNPPQTLNSDKCSNPDSSGYIDDSTIRDNSEEMYSLDNDSFLNSLEAMTIQNYWTDSVKHTKL